MNEWPPILPLYQYAARIERVIDGDTFVASIDLGLRMYHRTSIRVKDIDTPELNSPDPVERARASAARDFVRELLPEGKIVVLRTAKPSIYNRVEAEVYYWTPDGNQHNLAATLSAAGFVKER